MVVNPFSPDPVFGAYLGTKFLRLEFERDVSNFYQWLILIHSNSLKAKVLNEEVGFGIVFVWVLKN